MRFSWFAFICLLVLGSLSLPGHCQQRGIDPQAQNAFASVGQGFAQGFAEAIRSASQQNMRPSQAAIDQQTALSMSYDNQLKRVSTYYEKRKMGRAYREAERGPQQTKEQMARVAKVQAPDRLSARQFDSVQGRINWPVVLKSERFTEHRQALDKLFARHVQAGGGINTSEYAEIQQVGKSMEEELKAIVEKTTPEQFVYSKKFITSLRYEARFEAGT